MTVAKAMMEKMGWSEGDGLGKDGQGMKTALKPQKKIDAAGIGAKNLNTNWIATSSAYDSILAKLNIAYQKPDGTGAEEAGSSGDEGKRKKSKDKKRKDKKGKKRRRADDDDAEDATSAASDAAVPSRSAMYAKRMKSKRLAAYSDVDKAEIFASTYRPVVTATVGLDTSLADEHPAPKQRIEYENGFTEDTQVDIYNQAMDKKNKGRLGLGQAKLSKSARRDAAERDATLARVGAYLQRKFEYGGNLSEMKLRSDLKKQQQQQADGEAEDAPAAMDTSDATASDSVEQPPAKKQKKHAGETKEERRARKAAKRARKAAKAAKKAA